LLKFEKNPNFNIKYLPNGREYLNSAKTGESGVKKLNMPELFQIFRSHSGMGKKSGVHGFGALEWWIAC
jgi:hypothetical protein